MVSFARQVSRFFKKWGLVGYGKNRTIFGLHPLIISIVYIILTLCLAHLLRKIITILFKKENVYCKRIAREFVATWELCAACYELIIVADNYGPGMYAAFLFLLTIWWIFMWETESACPYSTVEEVVKKELDPQDAALLITAQVLAALSTYKYVQLLWAMELGENHRGRAFERCKADLQVEMFEGALIEALATCACVLTSNTLKALEIKYSFIAEAFFSTTMVVAALNFTGGYFNPALATSITLGCKGNTFIEHFVVYWLGATLGALLARYTFDMPNFQRYLHNLRSERRH